MTASGLGSLLEAARYKSQRAYRYAVYFAPNVEHRWWAQGSDWLGRCALTHQRCPQPSVDGLSPSRFAQLTAQPRRYGFHATMKAPFVLAGQYQLGDLVDHVNALCNQIAPFVIPSLQVAQLDSFLALVPQRASAQITLLEEQCVTQLNQFAEPLAQDELRRRRSAGLSAYEDALLMRWGYPYVLDRFRFHLSLTGSLAETSQDEVSALTRAANQHFSLLSDCMFDSLAIFAEPTKGADFVLLDRCPLIG